MAFKIEDHLLSQLGMQDAPTPPGADLAMRLPVHERLTNPRGGLQGGLVCTLVDVVAGRAAMCRAGEGKTVPTADLHVRFLSPITDGPAHAVARVVRQGRSSIIVQVDVRDEGRDVLAATATLAFTILDRRPEEERAERVFRRDGEPR